MAFDCFWMLLLVFMRLWSKPNPFKDDEATLYSVSIDFKGFAVWRFATGNQTEERWRNLGSLLKQVQLVLSCDERRCWSLFYSIELEGTKCRTGISVILQTFLVFAYVCFWIAQPGFTKKTVMVSLQESLVKKVLKEYNLLPAWLALHEMHRALQWIIQCTAPWLSKNMMPFKSFQLRLLLLPLLFYCV